MIIEGGNKVLSFNSSYDGANFIGVSCYYFTHFKATVGNNAQRTMKITLILFHLVLRFVCHVLFLMFF